MMATIKKPLYFMKLKSKVKEMTVSKRTIILKKYTNKPITSESFFEIHSQPPNTCPMIDSAQEELRIMTDDCFKTRNQIDGLEKSVRTHEEELDCDCHKVLKNNLINLNDFSNEISLMEENIEDTNNYLEALRAACESERNYGQDLKEIIWDFYEENLPFDEFNNSFKQILQEYESLQEGSSLSIKRLEKIFQKYDCSPPKFVESSCSYNCLNHIENQGLESLFEDLYIEIYLPTHVDNAFSNLESIRSWVYKITEVFDKVDKDKIIEVSKEEKQEYISILNEKIKKEFLSTKDSLFSSLNNFSLKKEIDSFFKNTENHIITKKIQEFELESNLLINDIKKFNFNDDYETVCTNIQGISNQEEQLRKNVYILLHNNPAVADLKSLIEKLFSKIETIHQFLKNKCPQIFEEVLDSES